VVCGLDCRDLDGENDFDCDFGVWVFRRVLDGVNAIEEEGIWRVAFCVYFLVCCNCKPQDFDIDGIGFLIRQGGELILG